MTTVTNIGSPMTSAETTWTKPATAKSRQTNGPGNTRYQQLDGYPTICVNAFTSADIAFQFSALIEFIKTRLLQNNIAAAIPTTTRGWNQRHSAIKLRPLHPDFIKWCYQTKDMQTSIYILGKSAHGRLRLMTAKLCGHPPRTHEVIRLITGYRYPN